MVDHWIHRPKQDVKRLTNQTERDMDIEKRLADISTERLEHVVDWHEKQASMTKSHNDKHRHLSIASEYRREIDRRDCIK